MTSPGTFSFGKSYVRISIQWEVLYILHALASTGVARPNTVHQKSEYCATAQLRVCLVQLWIPENLISKISCGKATVWNQLWEN
jgi:hypothetical protein